MRIAEAFHQYPTRQISPDFAIRPQFAHPIPAQNISESDRIFQKIDFPLIHLESVASRRLLWVAKKGRKLCFFRENAAGQENLTYDKKSVYHDLMKIKVHGQLTNFRETGRNCIIVAMDLQNVETQMKPMVRITNTHRVRVTLESSVAVITTLADRVSSPPMFFAMM